MEQSQGFFHLLAKQKMYYSLYENSWFYHSASIITPSIMPPCASQVPASIHISPDPYNRYMLAEDYSNSIWFSKRSSKFWCAESSQKFNPAAQEMYNHYIKQFMKSEVMTAFF